MKARHTDLVRTSFALVRPDAAAVARSFYARLFENDPSLRTLFRGDLERQGERLMSMIASAVDLLGRPEALLPVLRDLGARHVAYGVVERHYASVGQALLATLEAGLGERFTVDVRDAWVAVYDVISGTMLEGARTASERSVAMV